MFDYSQARADAEEIISEFGYPGDFIKKGTTGGTDSRGRVIADTDDTVISGTITPALSYKSYNIDGESILATDCYVFFHSDDAPGIGYTTTIDLEEYYVVDIKSLTGNGINVYRKLQLRK